MARIDSNKPAGHHPANTPPADGVVAKDGVKTEGAKAPAGPAGELAAKATVPTGFSAQDGISQAAQPKPTGAVIAQGQEELAQLAQVGQQLSSDQLQGLFERTKILTPQTSPTVPPSGPFPPPVELPVDAAKAALEFLDPAAFTSVLSELRGGQAGSAQDKRELLLQDLRQTQPLIHQDLLGKLPQFGGVAKPFLDRLQGLLLPQPFLPGVAMPRFPRPGAGPGIKPGLPPGLKPGVGVKPGPRPKPGPELAGEAPGVGAAPPTSAAQPASPTAATDAPDGIDSLGSALGLGPVNSEIVIPSPTFVALEESARPLLGLLSQPGVSIEMLVQLVMFELSRSAQDDVKELLEQTQANNAQKEALRNWTSQANMARASWESDLRAAYDARCALPPSDPRWIDATQLPFDQYAASQQLLLSAGIPQPSGGQLPSTIPSATIGAESYYGHQAPPPATDSGSSSTGSGTTGTSGTSGSGGTSGTTGTNEAGATSGPAQTTAQRYGITSLYESACKDYWNSLTKSQRDAYGTYDAFLQSGVGLQPGAANQGAKVESFFTALSKNSNPAAYPTGTTDVTVPMPVVGSITVPMSRYDALHFESESSLNSIADDLYLDLRTQLTAGGSSVEEMDALVQDMIELTIQVAQAEASGQPTASLKAQLDDAVAAFEDYVQTLPSDALRADCLEYAAVRSIQVSKEVTSGSIVPPLMMEMKVTSRYQMDGLGTSFSVSIPTAVLSNDALEDLAKGFLSDDAASEYGLLDANTTAVVDAFMDGDYNTKLSGGKVRPNGIAIGNAVGSAKASEMGVDLSSFAGMGERSFAMTGTTEASMAVASAPVLPPASMTLAEIDASIEAWESHKDTLADLSTEQSLKLQMAMDRLAKAQTTLSNLMKKFSDTAQSITGNLK